MIEFIVISFPLYPSFIWTTVKGVSIDFYFVKKLVLAGKVVTLTQAPNRILLIFMLDCNIH